jgi:hypothetical protein
MKTNGLIAILMLVILAGASCIHGSGKSTKGDAAIAFDTISHDFGEIPFSDSAEFEFVFINTGNAPLIVSHVKSTCGCTVPEWSKEPVKSGSQGVIRVKYDTHRVGRFAKSIYVYSNAANGVQKLSITGVVNGSDMNP